MSFIIRGVHPIDAVEPCHLIEIELSDTAGFDIESVTQEIQGEPEENWQVPYDERPLGKDKLRWSFFFHYLDFSKPLLTSFGEITLPQCSPVPEHLKNIIYESP